MTILEAIEKCEALRNKIDQLKELIIKVKSNEDEFPVKVSTLRECEQFYFKQLIELEQKLSGSEVSFR
ncbi:hypothetical protein WKH57_01660 [Niallia taxi]|uniref:hypothetical protein n=1 Tax=Niallia taxi TaxID=2499688 RepID=UPI00318135E9